MKTLISIAAVCFPLLAFFAWFLIKRLAEDEPLDDDDYNDHTFI
jgi:hypothetical protein